MNPAQKRKYRYSKDVSTNLCSLPSLYRGIYSRVADKMGCDPSYVSRVARGERTSAPISELLQAEVWRTLSLVKTASRRPFALKGRSS